MALRPAYAAGVEQGHSLDPQPPAAPALPGAERFAVRGSAGDMGVHVLRPPGPARGWAIVAHGRNGAAAAPHLAPVVAACLDRGLVVVAPDLCHSRFNDSAGEAGGFTMAAHKADVAAVAAWWVARTPDEPVRLLVGHSMGAYAVLAIAADPAAAARAGHPTGVLAISPAVSGAALIAARAAAGPDEVAALEREVPGALAEWPGHDVMPAVGAIAVPVAVIVGADDTLTTPATAGALAAALPRCVAHDVVPGEHHCPVGTAYAQSVAAALNRLIAP